MQKMILKSKNKDSKLFSINLYLKNGIWEESMKMCELDGKKIKNERLKKVIHNGQITLLLLEWKIQINALLSDDTISVKKNISYLIYRKL